MPRLTAPILLLLLTATAAIAGAEPIDLGPARLALDDAWRGAPVGTAPVTAVSRQTGAARLVALRYEVPNLEAWRDATRAAHVDAIVAGFARAPGYALLHRQVRRLGTAAVPTLDLAFRRRGPSGDEVVAVRVLLFRTTTIAAIAATPSDRAAVERAVTGLTPK